MSDLQSIDTSVIRQTIRALKADGYKLVAVNNGGEGDEPVTTEIEAIAEATAADDAMVYVEKDGKRSWFYAVLGNGEACDVIADYTVDLEAVMAPLYKKWEA